MTFPFFAPVFFKSRFAAGAPPLSRAECVELLVFLRRLTPERRRGILRSLPIPAVRALEEEWWWQAHGGQIEPHGDWRIWAIVAGRGFGKTRAGAEWVWQRARDHPGARIALVGATLDEVVDYQIEGEGGLLDCARCGEEPLWLPSKKRFHFPSGAIGFIRSAEKPAKLRGAQHHFAWCDELAKWRNADEAWNMLTFGMRLGERPRTIVTTTPQPVPALKRILALKRCARTQGRTDDNPHLPADYIEAVHEMYGGTRLGRQEIEGILFDDHPGALWTREMLDKARGPELFAQRRRDAEGSVALPPRSGTSSPPCDGLPALPGSGDSASLSASLRLCANPLNLIRIVVGVDPPASTGGDSCGIIVCGQDEDGIAWVIADLTVRGLSPEAWARRVAEAASLYGAGRIVAEKNQGGNMIESVLRAVDADLPVRLVHAGPSKAARAEPIALRFESGRAKLAGRFPELEDQLCALTWTGYHGEGSPDRADAMVWAMTELFEKRRREPRIRVLS